MNFGGCCLLGSFHLTLHLLLVYYVRCILNFAGAAFEIFSVSKAIKYHSFQSPFYNSFE